MNHCHTRDAALPTPNEPATADCQLLARFAQTRDEAAFRELVRRHSRLVFGVCVRVLRNRHDAEDAFQAVFMVLAKKADRVEVAESLGPWLYGVTYRVAVRAAQKRRRRRDQEPIGDVMVRNDILDDLANEHWRRVLDDELNQLPTKYREPLVLHYLFGKTNKEVAAELGLSVRTIEGRQRRGKERLRRRLAIRKVSLPLAVATLANVSQAVEAAVLEPLIETTVTASLAYVAGTEVAACSEGALPLARQEVFAMSLPVTPIAAVVTAVTTAVVIAGAALTFAGNDAAKTNASGTPLPLTTEIESQRQAGDQPLRDVAVQLATATTTPDASPIKRQPSQSATTPAMFQPRVQSPHERRIRETLTKRLISPLEFAETPLSQIMQIVSEDYGIQIVMDTAALDALAITPDTEITVNLRDIPLKSVLKLMLNSPATEDLTYLVKNDVLLITSVERAESELETRIYNVKNLGIDSEVVSKTLTLTVRPESWQENGSGEGALADVGGGMFSISQSQSVHDDIAAFLAELQAHVEAEQ